MQRMFNGVRLAPTALVMLNTSPNLENETLKITINGMVKSIATSTMLP